MDTTRTSPRTHKQQLERLEAEVEALRTQLRQAQRLAAMGTMTAMVAHEFNNILTPIINYAQMARSNPGMVPKAIARAADGGQRAAEICQAILGLSRGAGGVGPVPVLQVVRQTLAAMAREPQKDGIELVLDVPDDLMLRASEVELQQVLLNLLLNARQAVLARPSPRRVSVKARPSGGEVIIEVSDSGVGIEPGNLKRIFEPFFTTRKDTGGTGLGLAICRDIVTSMNGRIAVHSTPGQGSRFTIHLPSSAAA